MHDSQSPDAKADANRESEPVGCCRFDCPVCIQQSVPDGCCRITYAFWKCGWWETSIAKYRAQTDSQVVRLMPMAMLVTWQGRIHVAERLRLRSRCWLLFRRDLLILA